jgi:hypothetical protein
MSDEYEGDKYPSEEGFEPADDYGIESDSESESEEEEEEEEEESDPEPDEKEEDDDDTWMYVYNGKDGCGERFSNYISKDCIHLKHLRKGHYFQTFGGGPEGGYVSITVNGVNQVWRVTRTWGTPFTATLVPNVTIEPRDGSAPEYQMRIRLKETEEKESGVICVGDIVDCPAAREIEALGLATLEVSK